MAQQRATNWGLQVILCAVALTWQIYDMATATEAPSSALLAMHYIGIGLAFVGLVGGVVMMARGNAAQG